MMKLFTNVLIYLVMVCMQPNLSYGQSLARNEKVIVTNLPEKSSWDKKAGAVDGNYERNATNCNCCADSGYGDDPWFEIDFGKSNSFTRIVVYGRKDFDNVHNRIDNLTVELDNEEVVVFPTSHSSDPYFIHISLGQTLSATKMKLISRGQGKRFVLCEVDVFNDSIISTRKSTEANATNSNWKPSYAVDGFIPTNDPDACICCAAAELQADPWLKLDLGDTFFITLIQLYGSMGNIHLEQSFECMRIDIDDITIHTIPTSETPIGYYDLFPTPDKIGRYIKLTLTGNTSVLAICEIVVYGERVISINKSVMQDTTHETWQASRAVDGIFVTEQPIFCNCCSATKYTKDPWLEVDLGPNHNISRIVIYGRTDHEFPNQNFVDMNITLDSTLIQRIPKTDPVYWVDFYGFQLPVAQTGKLLRLTLMGPSVQMVVCELVAYGGCVEGYFGENCDQQCHCKGQLCNNLTGICPSSICKPGYKGDTCSERCGVNSYGQNCEKACGECRDSKVCNYISGFCDNCEDGYSLADKTCKTKCSPGSYGYNCSKSCGQCRSDESCNNVNGQCDVCADGYKHADSFCMTMCDNGTYGNNCAEQCGNCRDDEVCDKEDGRCTECEDGYTETDLTCKTERTNSQPEGSFPVGPIVGCIIGTIALGVFIIVAVIFLRKRRQNNKPVNQRREPERKKTRKRSTVQENVYLNDGIFDDASICHSEVNEKFKRAPEKADVENEYYNCTSTTPGISIHDFWEYIRKNKVDKGEGFCTEFKKLKDGLIFAHNDALANRKTIRYRELYPYDHSRVHLKVEKEAESEFINASHIDGYDETRTFIASQGPIKVMVDDFWRMVWQQNSTIIVMLTNLVEGGNHKCMQYWPDEGSVKFARITITMIQEKDLSDYCIRILEIQQDGGPPRRVRQFHFKAWPDKDIPDSTWSLSQFWRDIFRDKYNESGPIIVHCSAGVGRTGTFIALDNLYHQAAKTGKVTPFSIVETLRNQRVKMVQTSSQYIYVHEALADLLLFGTHYLWLSQFPEYYDFMIKKDKDKGKLRLRVQYEYLEKSLSCAGSKDGSYAVAADTLREIEEYRPKSATSVDQGPKNLCTIFLPGLNGPDSFLLTTLPDEKSIKECWKLIDEHSVEIVITLTDGTKESVWAAINDKGCESYHPVLTFDKQNGPLRERQFTYRCSRQTKHQGNRCETNIKQIEGKFSFRVGEESQANTLLKLLELVSTLQPHISTMEPVIIQCKDGFSDSGILSVLLNEKQRILKDGGQINILESVMMARRANKSCISSFSQYRFIHDIMIQVVETKEPVSAQEETNDLNIYQNM